MTAAGTQHNVVNTAVGYGSAWDVRVHFGLGSETTVRELQVVWPTRQTTTLRDVAVCMFTSAAQYLKTVEEGKASCVVIGLGLRGDISGLDLARAILASRRAIPVIFIAGPADAPMKAQALLMGCIAYLEEPVSSELLVSAIIRSGSVTPRRPPPGPGR